MKGSSSALFEGYLQTWLAHFKWLCNVEQQSTTGQIIEMYVKVIFLVKDSPSRPYLKLLLQYCSLANSF